MADDLSREADQAFRLRSSDNSAPGTTSMERPGPTLDHVSSASIKSGIAGYDVSRASDNLGADSSQPQQSPAGSGLTGGDASNTLECVYPNSKTKHKLNRHRSEDPGVAARMVWRSHEHAGHGHQFEPVTDGPTTYPHFTSGPHITDIANVLDPHVQTSDAGANGSSRIPDRDSSMQAPTSASTSQHNYGRDAGLASAGVAGAGGLYEAREPAGRPDTGPASSTLGHHESNFMNVIDPRVQPDPSVQGRQGGGPTSTDPARHTTGPHSSDAMNVVDPRVKPEPSNMKDNRSDARQAESISTGKDHHYGRDAAIAGDEGAAGAGAYEAVKTDRDYGVPGAQPGSVGPNPYTRQPIDPRVDGPMRRSVGNANRSSQSSSQTHPAHRESKSSHLSPSGSSDSHEKERKPSLMDRIFHRHRNSEDHGDEDLGDGRVREQHTGLPMNVGKYGSGEGGTDASRQIHGYERDVSPSGVDTSKLPGGEGAVPTNAELMQQRGVQAQHDHGRDTGLAGAGLGAGALAGHEASQRHGADRDAYALPATSGATTGALDNQRA
ncbi:hypothetical protein LTS18_003677, partial [Coniosporium uncinatum]